MATGAPRVVHKRGLSLGSSIILAASSPSQHPRALLPPGTWLCSALLLRPRLFARNPYPPPLAFLSCPPHPVPHALVSLPQQIYCPAFSSVRFGIGGAPLVAFCFAPPPGASVEYEQRAVLLLSAGRNGAPVLADPAQLQSGRIIK